MDGVVMDEKHPLVSVEPAIVLQDKIGNKVNIKITCKDTFDTDKELEIWAVTKDKDGTEESELAGKLIVIAPKKRMTLDVVVVRVKTSAGKGSAKSLNIFQRNLRQALIDVNVVTMDTNSIPISLDLTNPANNYNSINFNTEYEVSVGDIKKTSGQSIELEDLLSHQLEKIYPGKFTNHFKLFFLNNSCGTEDVKDGSGAIISQKNKAGYSKLDTTYGIMFSTHNDSTIGHECMHGLGLHHTFFDERFTYKALKTDNIMDYSQLTLDTVTGSPNSPIERVSSFYWQWGIIKKKKNQSSMNKKLGIIVVVLLITSCTTNYLAMGQKTMNGMFEKFDIQDYKNKSRDSKEDQDLNDFTLKDGTRIIRSGASYGFDEEQISAKPDFYKIVKEFYPSGSIKQKGYMFGNLSLGANSIKIGKWYYFNEQDKLDKEVDEDKKFELSDIMNYWFFWIRKG
ncbi:hypothetical protein [Pedobacter sp. NJ-S-72]